MLMGHEEITTLCAPLAQLHPKINWEDRSYGSVIYGWTLTALEWSKISQIAYGMEGKNPTNLIQVDNEFLMREPREISLDLIQNYAEHLVWLSDILKVDAELQGERNIHTSEWRDYFPLFKNAARVMRNPLKQVGIYVEGLDELALGSGRIRSASVGFNR